MDKAGEEHNRAARDARTDDVNDFERGTTAQPYAAQASSYPAQHPQGYTWLPVVAQTGAPSQVWPAAPGSNLAWQTPFNPTLWAAPTYPLQYSANAAYYPPPAFEQYSNSVQLHQYSQYVLPAVSYPQVSTSAVPTAAPWNYTSLPPMPLPYSSLYNTQNAVASTSRSVSSETGRDMSPSFAGSSTEDDASTSFSGHDSNISQADASSKGQKKRKNWRPTLAVKMQETRRQRSETPVKAAERQSRIQDVVHFKPITEATLGMHERAMTVWHLFRTEVLGESTAQSEATFRWQTTYRMSAADLKGYVAYQCTAKVGRISDRPAIGTIRGYILSLIGAYRRRTGISVEKMVVDQSMAYLLTEAKDEFGLINRPTTKFVADGASLQVILHYNWLKPARCLREIVQMDSLFKVLAFTASRPGEVVTTQDEEALRWGDIDWTAKKTTDGEVTVDVAITFRLLKGHRTDANFFKSVPLLMNRSKPSMCPVLPLLSLALADGIFEDFDTVQTLLDSGSQFGSDSSIALRVRAERTQLYVYRRTVKVEAEYGTSRVESLNYSSLSSRLAAVSAYAGFLNRVKPYDLRRGAANALDEANVSLANRRQAMGHHEHSRVFNAYKSGLVGIDIAAYYMGTAEERERVVAVVHKQTHLRYSGPPLALSPQKRLELLRDPAIVDADQQLKVLRAALLLRYKDVGAILAAVAAETTSTGGDEEAQAFYRLKHKRSKMMADLYAAAWANHVKASYEDAQKDIFRTETTTKRSKVTEDAAALKEKQDDGAAGLANEQNTAGVDLPLLLEADSASLPVDFATLGADDVLRIDYNNLDAEQVVAMAGAEIDSLLQDDIAPASDLHQEAQVVDPENSQDWQTPANGQTAVGVQTSGGQIPNVVSMIMGLLGTAISSREQAVKLVSLMSQDESLKSVSAYFPGEEPTDGGACPRCDKKLTGRIVERAMHIHHCTRRHLAQEYIQQLEDGPARPCPKASCQKKNGKRINPILLSPSDLAKHLYKYVTTNMKKTDDYYSSCPFDECSRTYGDKAEMLRHLEADHSLPIRQARSMGEYCVECEAWILVPERLPHHMQHKDTLLVQFQNPEGYSVHEYNHRTIRSGFCPFCPNLLEDPSNVTQAFSARDILGIHVSKHIYDFAKDDVLTCPASCCSTIAPFKSREALAHHVEDDHHIRVSKVGDSQHPWGHWDGQDSTLKFVSNRTSSTKEAPVKASKQKGARKSSQVRKPGKSASYDDEEEPAPSEEGEVEEENDDEE